MNTQEFRKKISESKNKDWLNDIEITVEYRHIKFSQKLKGLSSIYTFVLNQIGGWEKFGNDIPTLFQISKDYFSACKDELIGVIALGDDIRTLRDVYNQKDNFFDTLFAEALEDKFYGHIFTYDSPYTDFIFNIYKEKPDSIEAAYLYIIGEFQIKTIDDFHGYFAAYSFDNRYNKKVSQNEGEEKISVEKTISNLTAQLSEVEQLIFSKFKHIDETYSTWFNDTKKAFRKFETESKERKEELENTYQEHLRLKKPAEYWNARAVMLKKEGWKAIYWLVGLVVFACVTLYLLLWLTPEGMLLSFIEGQASAIKWSIVYVTFISFLAYGIRALHRVSFSSFHLARDAEEREQLTYFYLSLINDSKVDEKDKNLIMQSLFSRADTGLLKDDTSPTMPNDFAGKFFGGK